MSTGYQDLAGRVAIITGGGRGFGRLMAEALLARGARVTITAARQPDQLEAVVRQAPGQVLALGADVRDPTGCAEVVGQTAERFGGVDILINNAARAPNNMDPDGFAAGPLKSWEQPFAQWQEITATNLDGAYAMIRAAVPVMLARGWGRVINLSTSRLTMIARNLMPYGPTKAALETYTRVLAEELRGTGVTANVLLPGGATDTDFIPAKTWGDRSTLLPASIIVPPALFLCSSASDGLTGRRLVGRLWDQSLPVSEAAAAAQEPYAQEPAIL